MGEVPLYSPEVFSSAVRVRERAQSLPKRFFLFFFFVTLKPRVE